MKKITGIAVALVAMATTPVMAAPYQHAFEPTTGVEVQMVGAPSRSDFDFRSMLGVTLPAVGVEVHMGDLVSPELAAASYDPEGVPGTWQQINPAVGVEKHLMQ